MEAATRRSVLRRGVALVTGAVGVGIAASKGLLPGTGSSPPEPAHGGQPVDALAPVTSAGPTVFTVHGRDWHSYTQSRPAGVLPERGDRLTAHGALLDQPDGQVIGEFYAAGFALNAPGRFQPSDAGRLELHTLNLPDGTIIGTGLPTHDDSADTFAVLGGTGKYAGARGTYQARQDHQELGGNGSAEFTITLIP